MFGQQNTPFGSPQGTGGFGATNTAPAFGSPAPAPFGAPASGFGGGATGFGSPAPAPGGFGAAGGFGAPSNTGFGNTGFGAPAAPAQTGFGAAGGGFGSTTATSPFGAPTPAPSGGLFGSTAPAPSGGLFGSTNTSTGFGATNTSTGFGAGGGGAFGAGSTGAFGAQQPSAFGTPAPAVPSTGLFGAPTPAPAFGSTGFGATNNTFSPAPAPSGGIFGATASPGTGLFGATTTAPGQQQPGQGGGSKITPFQVTNRQDGASTISMQSITAMPQYENKSFEELRYEDYMQGNRGSSATPTGGSNFSFGGAAAAPAGGIFGAPTPAPAPFGAPAPAPFGSPAPAPFGSPAPAPFGAPAAPAPFSFGSPAPAPFGAPAPAPFGAPAAPAFGSTAFGSKPAGGLFGAPAPASGGLFGSSPAPAPAFGAPAPAGGLFGAAPTPAPGGLFGNPAPAPGGLFGNTPAPAPAFGAAPAPAGGGLFGAAPAPASGGLFGSPSPAPAFGAPAAGGLFGAPAPPASGGLFGTKSPGSLFGAPPTAAPGGLFGTAAPAAPAGGLFGAQPQVPVAPAAYPPAGSIVPPAANEVLTHQLTALENKRKEIEKLDVWRGNSPESSALIPLSQHESDSHIMGLVSSTSQQSHSPYRPLTKSTAKIRPRGFAPGATSPSSTPLTSIGSGARPMMSPDTYVASSVKRLVIKPGSLTPKPRMRLRLTDSPASTETGLIIRDASAQPNDAIISHVQDGYMASPEAPMQTSVIENRASSLPASDDSRLASTAAHLLSPRKETSPAQQRIFDASPKDSPSNEPGLDYYRKVVGSPDSVSKDASTTGLESTAVASFMPKLTKSGYQVTPSLEEMSSYSEADLAAVEGFSVKRMPFGMVQWEGFVDVRGANLDRVVEIAQSDISVYHEEEENKKPAVGSKLNRPAVLTFCNVFPKGGAGADDETKNKFIKKIEKTTKKLEAELISYNPDSGDWKIRVEHFSRYFLDEDTSEDESTAGVTFQGSTPGGSLVVGRLQDEEMEEDAAIVSDVETTDHESNLRRNAEAAYEMMFGVVNEAEDDCQSAVATEQTKADDLKVDFFQETQWEEGSVSVVRRPVTDEDYLTANAGVSICSKIARNSGINSSNTDFGMRMGRSFRVGWSRDGSFVRLRSTGKSNSPSLSRCRPMFTERKPDESRQCHLETHKTHAIKCANEASDCPRYMLPQGNWKSGDQSSQYLLYNTISSYARMKEATSAAVSEEDLVVDRAFSLLLCLLASGSTENLDAGGSVVLPKNKKNAGDRRRREAICRWLIQLCERDVDREIAVSKQRNGVHSAVFAALSGGDVEKASDTSMTMGDVHLSVLLASGVEGQRDIMEQLRVWQESSSSLDVPHQLLRIYRLIGGDLKGEGKLCKAGESSLDWRRHLAMHMTIGITEQCVADVLRIYNSDISAGVAPYPYPCYLSSRGNKTMIQCVLFRLLRLLEEPQKIPLLEIVDPLGHGKFAHDVGFAFHLAAVLTAMGICQSLSDYDEFRLADSYMAQLVSQDKWEWAVYVSLCSSGSKSLETTTWQLKRAKDLVLQNFCLDDPHASRRRRFLEGVGVPLQWIEEALAVRCMHLCGGSSSFEFIRHLSRFSPPEASQVVDNIIVPNLLFMNSGDVDRGLKHLKIYGSAIGPLGCALFNLFELAKDIRSLARAERQDVEDALPTLVGICDEIEKTLAKRQSANLVVKSPAIGFIPDFRTVPFTSMLAEAMEHITFLRLQLEALRSGISISTGATTKKLPAELAFIGLAAFDERYTKGTRLVRGLR